MTTAAADGRSARVARSARGRRWAGAPLTSVPSSGGGCDDGRLVPPCGRHHVAHDGEAEAGALARGLGREEGIEDMARRSRPECRDRSRSPRAPRSRPGPARSAGAARLRAWRRRLFVTRFKSACSIWPASTKDRGQACGHVEGAARPRPRPGSDAPARRTPSSSRRRREAARRSRAGRRAWSSRPCTMVVTLPICSCTVRSFSASREPAGCSARSICT